ncbi:metallophosphoesterase family protein [Sphingobium sp.]|uniref:metallophosphoesterase family protein n=1 Tax=Sphingobium sp. TaxID=1912891 RepID=UPI003BB587B5
MALGRAALITNKPPSTQRGERIYVVGDVHGRVDLMRALFERIENHLSALPGNRTVHLVLLGDLIDRGPDSAGVLRFLYNAQKHTDMLVILRGNHEDMMLRAIEGEPGVMRAWMRMGGDATLRSFGIEPPESDADIMPAARALATAIPRPMLDWLRSLPLTAQSGDYLFCHAGIRPGVAIKRQSREDLLWIREEFLSDTTNHGVVVVHGHSIATKVEMRPNRIGIDTGAYRTGVLTALYLEDAVREIIAVGPADAAPAVQSSHGG